MNTPFIDNKLYWHKDRIDEWKKNRSVSPITLEIDLTNVCNHKCPECVGYGFTKERDHSKETWDRQILFNMLCDIRSSGVKGVCFTGGGEPTLSQHLSFAIDCLSGFSISTALITNGQSIMKSQIESAVRHCDWIRVSWDAGSQEVFFETHGVGGTSFHKVVQNTHKLSSEKKLIGSNVSIGVGYLTGKKTHSEDMILSVKKAKEAGVDYFQFRPYLERFYPEEWVSYEVEAFFETLSVCKSYENESFSVFTSEPKYRAILENRIERGYKTCHASVFAGVISADKHVYYCCHTRGQPFFDLGKLNEDGTGFLNTFNSESRTIIDRDLDVTTCPPLCRLNALNENLDHSLNDDLWNYQTTEPTHPNFL